MAQLDKHNQLFGGLGDLVFKQVNGKTIVQLKPGKNGVKQSQPTKLSASDFGTASSTTKRLSISLRSLFHTYYDSQMYNRFRKTVYQAMLHNTEILKGQKDLWEGDISLLDGFEFNLDSLYTDYCMATINCSLSPANEIRLDIGEFNPKSQLRWPKKTHKAELCFLVSTYTKENYTPKESEIFKVEVSSFSPPIAAQSFTTSSLSSNCLVLISSCVLYFKNDSVMGDISLNHKKLHPAKIEKALKILS